MRQGLTLGLEQDRRQDTAQDQRRDQRRDRDAAKNRAPDQAQDRRQSGRDRPLTVDAQRWAGAPLDPAPRSETVFDALVRARRRHGGATVIVQEAGAAPLSYDRLIGNACALGQGLARLTAPAARVGMMLPTGTAALVAFFALQARGRVPVMLPWAATQETVAEAAAAAGVSLTLTARRFVDAADLAGHAKALREQAPLVDLSEIVSGLGPLAGAMAWLGRRLPMLRPGRRAPGDPAVILFTSGTTGRPKGVVLSHANILANVAQVRRHIRLARSQVFFTPLPLFHALGLNAGTLLPVLSGVRTVLHSSPLDHRRIPGLIRDSGANVLIATDPLARLYLHAAEDAALAGLDHVVLGGEPVRQSTLRRVAAKTGAEVLPGYGTTECAPVVAVNRPGACRSDTVGTLLPGMEAWLRPIPGVARGGRLLVRGPNVMLGYLDPAAPGRPLSRADVWFDTGDLARVDADRYLSILGRVGG
ncbi:hypothetical protein CCR85_06390 [Rhodothalassium salexigens]|uniref:AMP-binding protein n=1 Tax=Rhodothalassium salexigens TaxID=1086 RepID=UPI00191369E7|nr:AMP-binding protein [Rhodothalassium salexigens]MBK5911119.1 hypothetical protein [Rhodothalassium salexigens]